MKVYSLTTAHWTSLLGILIVINETFAQTEPTFQDPVTLCNKKSTLYCELLENYRQQNDLNTFLQKLNDGENSIIKFKNRNHIGPRFALYDNTGNTPQYPFSSGWKGQLGKTTWDVQEKMRRMQSRKPFNYDRKRTTDESSNWNGKSIQTDDTVNNKREPAFSSWGGKRTQKFFNWGGKRSVSENDLNNAIMENYEHNIMKRSANGPFNKIVNGDKEKKICITDSMNIQELFKEFLEWSRKQPEQKKGSFYRKMFSVSTLHSPDNLSRRAGSFYPWGGKRSSKQN